nr:hypothetical protein [Tanacetum cinerariifolium]
MLLACRSLLCDHSLMLTANFDDSAVIADCFMCRLSWLLLGYAPIIDLHTRYSRFAQAMNIDLTTSKTKQNIIPSEEIPDQNTNQLLGDDDDIVLSSAFRLISTCGVYTIDKRECKRQGIRDLRKL